MNKLEQVGHIDPLWMLAPYYASGIIPQLESLDVVECAIRQAEFDAREIESANAAKAERAAKNEPEPKPFAFQDGLASFTLSGPITKKPTSAQWMLGGTSSLMLARQIRLAKSDPDVTQGFMRVESPGGQAAGCAELAQAVAEFAAVKPFISFIDDEGASAAYFAACPSTKIYMNRMGMAGCIGSVMRLADTSAMAAQQGVKVHVLGSGKYKGAGAAGAPLTESHLEYFQSIVDHFANDFVSTVAEHRGMTMEEAWDMADGRMYTAQEALDLGLIDGICSLDECLQTILQGSTLQETAASNGATPIGDNQMANEKPTLLDRLFGKVQAELEAEGINLDAAGGGEPNAAVTQVDPAITQQIEAQAAQLSQLTHAAANAEATTYAESLVHDRKISPKEQDAAKNLYLSALAADGGGTPKFENNELVKGTNVKAVTDVYEARSAIPEKLWSQLCVGEGAEASLTPGEGSSVISEARKAELLSLTSTGQAVLKEKK